MQAAQAVVKVSCKRFPAEIRYCDVRGEVAGPCGQSGPGLSLPPCARPAAGWDQHPLGHTGVLSSGLGCWSSTEPPNPPSVFQREASSAQQHPQLSSTRSSAAPAATPGQPGGSLVLGCLEGHRLHIAVTNVHRNPGSCASPVHRTRGVLCPALLKATNKCCCTTVSGKSSSNLVSGSLRGSISSDLISYQSRGCPGSCGVVPSHHRAARAPASGANRGRLQQVNFWFGCDLTAAFWCGSVLISPATRTPAPGAQLPWFCGLRPTPRAPLPSCPFCTAMSIVSPSRGTHRQPDTEQHFACAEVNPEIQTLPFSRAALQEIRTVAGALKCNIALKTTLTFINSDSLCYSNLHCTFLIYAIGIN